MESTPNCQPNDGCSPKSTNAVLFKYLGASVFYYYLLLLVIEIIHGLVYGDFTWNLGYLILFWIASSIYGGSTTGCKWGIFCMVLCGFSFIGICFMLFLQPAQYEFYYHVTSATRPFYFTGAFAYVIWSAVNLKYLLRLLKLRQVRHWTKGTIIGYGFCFLLLIIIACSVTIPLYMNYREGYSKAVIKTKYADVIEYLQKAAKDEMPTYTNAPEVMALSEMHPEIISASVHYSENSSMSIISKHDFKETSTWTGGGSGIDAEGNKFKYVIYKDYTQDKNGKWVKIQFEVYTTSGIKQLI